MKPRTIRIIAIAVAASMLALAVFWTLSRTEPRRRSPFNQPGSLDRATADSPPLAELPQDRWTERIIDLQRAAAWTRLGEELEELRRVQPAAFEAGSLGYLLARVLIEAGELERAEKELVPWLLPESPFAPLARHHAIEIAAGKGAADEAARLRGAYIFDEPDALWRSRAIESHLEYLEDENPAQIVRFAEKLRPAASTALRRELDSRAAAGLLAAGQEQEARQIAWMLLKGGTSDDPSERALLILDVPGVTGPASGTDLALLAETARNHRHFDRAVELFEAARERNGGTNDDLLFAIGRSYFGNEKFAEAEKTYLAGAADARSAELRAGLFFHASRAAQLMGEDDRAIRHMTRAIAVRGNFGATSAAITQRMRTRAKQGDLEAARSDLRMLEKLLPRSEARAEVGIQFATYLIAAGQHEQALAELDRIPLRLADVWAESEMDYWRGRSWEGRDPERAVQYYLETLQYEVPTHFAFLARERLQLGPLREALSSRVARARADRDAAVEASDWGSARQAGTVADLLSGSEQDRAALRAIYLEIPAYREVLELTPEPPPSFPLDAAAEPADYLMAMGLFDEAQREIGARWGLRPMRDALTRSHALNLAAASRDSIYAIEVMMRSVPDGFVQELLPLRVRQLLYPRYFAQIIERDSERFGADPRLVLSIMREESRFDPRAKSIAAARGLLQFIITTARDIGASLGLVDLQSADLYDPRTIIQLGARYVADLLEEFDGSRYKAASAYNAGPFQTRLWSRLQPAEGDDYFLTSVNFSETKHYVRKVMNSYQRYGEIYEGGPVTGGVPAEP
ncbi:MAG: transglycosylase SLT domain-containing protein [Thermoanaerobaculia bacterium]